IGGAIPRLISRCRARTIARTIAWIIGWLSPAAWLIARFTARRGAGTDGRGRGIAGPGFAPVGRVGRNLQHTEIGRGISDILSPAGHIADVAVAGAQTEGFTFQALFFFHLIDQVVHILL